MKAPTIPAVSLDENKVLEIVPGLTLHIRVREDLDGPYPWLRGERHGPVCTGYKSRRKRAGERCLTPKNFGMGTEHFYDMQAAQKIALAEGWGIAKPEGLTRRQIAAEAVRQDFEYLRAYVAGEWQYVDVTVCAMLAGEGGALVAESIGGIESNAPHIIQEAAQSLAAEVISQIRTALEETADKLEERTENMRGIAALLERHAEKRGVEA